MRRNVVTLTKVWGTTVMLVAMTAEQVNAWKWVGDELRGEDPVKGWEVRDVEGALLGVVLPLGHKAGQIHAEWYDPAIEDFCFAGVTRVPVLKHGVGYVLSHRRHEVAPVPSGEGVTLRPNAVPVDCMYSRCAPGCAHCHARHLEGVAREQARAAERPKQAAEPAVQLELAIAA